jgi:glucokinase
VKVLAVDVGGTKSRFGLFEIDGDHLERLAETTFWSADGGSLEELAKRFFAEQAVECSAAAFGVPGPVQSGRAKATNLPWVVDATRLSAELRIERVVVLNDLEATAHGIDHLATGELQPIAAGDGDPGGNAAVVAAGTGLGLAGLYWDGTRHRPFATEGGHAGFAPHGELEIELHRHLAARFGHVSWERVLSGPGLVNIHEFLRAYRKAEIPDWLHDAMRSGDPAAVISRAAGDGSCAICTEALDRFVRLYGRFSGNVALTFLATGGVYLGGGIAPKLSNELGDGRFLEAFLDKGRMRTLLEQMPVHIIMNDRLPVIGAAWRAAAAAA